jgi:hypothetical protein
VDAAAATGALLNAVALAMNFCCSFGSRSANCARTFSISVAISIASVVKELISLVV